MPNIMSDLTNFLSGGANQNAQGDLQNILNQIEGISTPTAGQLQLSPLEQYQVAATLAPALAQAAQAGPSAYNNENISQVPISTMQQVLAQEGAIANAGGMTPQEQAAIGQAIESVNTNLAGQRGAIAQNFAGMGVPQSLISAALQNQSAGQNAQNAYNAALQAQGQAAQQGLTALQNEAGTASTLYGQEANQANTVAAAQNALNQFNAANTQQMNLANQANTQAANTYNTETKQNVGNQNVAASQAAQYQNQVQAPQEAASLALQRGQELTGIGEAQANQQTQQGQQGAGLFSGLLGAGAELGSAALLGPSAPIALGAANALAANGPGMPQNQIGYIPNPYAEGGEVPKPKIPAINFLGGGDVPGRARVSGDSEINDTVPAKLSPGEFVVPRTAMARPEVRNFIARNVPTPRPPSANPSDIASIIKALSILRAGTEA